MVAGSNPARPIGDHMFVTGLVIVFLGGFFLGVLFTRKSLTKSIRNNNEACEILKAAILEYKKAEEKLDLAIAERRQASSMYDKHIASLNNTGRWN